MKEINPETVNSISNFINLNVMNQKIVDEAVSKIQKQIIKNEKINREKLLNQKFALSFVCVLPSAVTMFGSKSGHQPMKYRLPFLF